MVPYCSKKAKHTIKECHNVASSNGGVCLSSTYKNNSTRMRWMCEFGHKWDSVFAEILRGKWCPECSDGKTQQMLTSIFRSIFPKYKIISDFRGFSWLK